MMMDQNSGSEDKQLVTSMGRARGLIVVWEEVKRRRDRIWLSTCPTLGHGRAGTLALLSEMVVQNAKVPGLRHPQPMGRGLAGATDCANGPSPSMGRSRARKPGPHSHVVDSPSKFPIPGLNASVCAGEIYLPYLIHQSLPRLDLLVLTWTQTQPPLDFHFWRL